MITVAMSRVVKAVPNKAKVANSVKADRTVMGAVRSDAVAMAAIAVHLAKVADRANLKVCPANSRCSNVRSKCK
jgi:hypothetical protein